MTHRVLACAAAALAAWAGPSLASSCDSLSALDGLLGDWTAERAESVFTESWRAIDSRTWSGSGLETPGTGDGASAEDLRLVEMGGGVFYLAKVADNDLPVAFRLVECADNRFVFANAGHDFPRRLEYRIGADGRLAVDVDDGAGKGFTLSFSRGSAAADDEAAVLAAEDARFAAMVAGDAEGMRRAFADDLSYVHATGGVQGRDDLVSSIAEGRLHYDELAPAERKVVFLGPGAAYVLGRGHIRARAAGRELDFQARYVAIYGRSGGTWRLRAWQSLRLP